MRSSHIVRATVNKSVHLFSKKLPTAPVGVVNVSNNNIVSINSSVVKINQNECYALLKELRKDDVFPAKLKKKEMIDLFFPSTGKDMALSLSNVTSAFYGVMLQTCANLSSAENIDKISKDFFYNLGKLKTKLTVDSANGKFDIPADARGVVILLVSAIYNASPEYTFQIVEYSKEHCVIELKGADRYYRITKLLGINDKIEFPVLHRFLEGINDELKAGIKVKSEMLQIEDSGACHERFTMSKR